MKRSSLPVALLAFAALFLSSCRDHGDPLGPEEAVGPSMGVLDLEDRIDLLIDHLYPGPGLRQSAQGRWRNIQRQMDRVPEAAQDQARELVSDALELLAGGRLLDPDHPDVPVSTARDGVRLLASYLYSFTGLEEVPVLDPEFYQAQDQGSGWITPEEGGEITTESGWARLTVDPGEVEEDVLITIELIDDARCDPDGTLTAALGCWDFDKYGGGDFPSVVEICVADPGPPGEPGGMTDAEYYIDLRVHRQEEAEGSVPVALPYVNSTLDCSQFPVGVEPAPAPAAAEGPSLLAALGSRVASLFLPDPLVALVPAVRRPPRGIGGLAGSFTWYFGAVPLEEQEDYASLPLGTGGAESWEVVTPEALERLCVEADPNDCPAGSVTEVDVSAVLTEDSGVDTDPWWQVFFYFKPAGEAGPLSFIGSTGDFLAEDNGSVRLSTWTITLSGSHPELPDGPIDVFAVGARGPEEGGDIFATDPASFIDVVRQEVVEPLQTVSTMGAGGDFSCALRSDGKAFCWGYNSMGQLGDGTRTYSAVPVEVSGGHTFDQLLVGGRGACGLTSSGDAYCWGSNSYGWLGAGLPITTQDNFSLVPVLVAGGHRWVQLSLHYRTACGIADDGITYCWGHGRFGALGNGTAGTGNDSNVPVPVTNSATLGFVRVSAGARTSCALDGDGTPYCWGLGRLFGNDPESEDSYTPTLAVSGKALSVLDVGTGYLCGVDGDQDAHCWGFYASYGTLGNGTTDPVYTPTPVAGGHSFEIVDANANNTSRAVTCGLTPEGEVLCWGNNNHGQVGGPGTDICNSESCALTPVPVSGGITFSSIDVGLDHVCGLDAGGTMYCWGDNGYGQLGDGGFDDSSVPVPVGELTEAPGAGPIVVTPLVSSLTLRGETLQLTAEAQDRDGVPLDPQPPLTWASSDPAVAEVDADGVVTAVSDGTAVIHVAAPDGAIGRATINVTITDPVQAFNRALNSGGANGVILISDLVADELINSGSFGSHHEADRRSIPPDGTSWPAGIYNSLETARIALDFEAVRLQAVDPTSPEIGDLLTRSGFVYLAYAQNYCSGVPLDDPNVGVSTTGLLELAVARFDGALTGPISPEVLTAAQLGKARSHQRLGDHAAAVAAASTVPTDFTWGIPHTTVQGEENAIFMYSREQRRVSVADNEGGNGLPFRSADDPRVPWTYDGIGTDGVSPHYSLHKFPTASSPMPLATGLEARLIEAEAFLRQNDVDGFLSRINGIRAISGLSPLVDPGTAEERVNLLFSERAFTLFATGQRLGDLRRLVSVYGRSPSDVFPVGPHQSGGNYGTDGNLPVPLSARGPGFTGCSVRTH